MAIIPITPGQRKGLNSSAAATRAAAARNLGFYTPYKPAFPKAPGANSRPAVNRGQLMYGRTEYDPKAGLGGGGGGGAPQAQTSRWSEDNPYANLISRYE